MSSQYLLATRILLLAFLITLAAVDFSTHRIPNRLTCLAAGVAALLHVGAEGPPGLLECGAGLLAGLGIFLPFFLARGFGAGDVKAMAAVGAFLGPHSVLVAAACTLIAGAIAGLVVLLCDGGGVSVLSLFRIWAFRAYVLGATGHAVPVSSRADDIPRRRFPYGVAIACGAAASLLWG